MKRLLNIMFIFALLFLIAGLASAGVLSSTKGWIVDNALQSIIGLVFMFIAGFWGGSVWGKRILKSKIPVQKAIDIYQTARNARRPNSPGGKDITDEEKAAIWKDVQEFAGSIIEVFGGKVPA